jgi:hypothetical protein
MGATQELKRFVMPQKRVVLLTGSGALEIQAALGKANRISAVKLTKTFDSVFQLHLFQTAGQIAPLSSGAHPGLWQVSVHEDPPVLLEILHS